MSHLPSGVAQCLMIFAILMTGSCTHRTQMQLLALAVKSSLKDFNEQKEVVSQSFYSANEARENLPKVELKFGDKKTQVYMKKWRSTEREVTKLFQRFNQSIKKLDYLFAYAEKKSWTISDDTKRTRMQEVINNKKMLFANASLKTKEVIFQLHAVIAKGNDIFTALEIVGVLNSVGEELDQLAEISELATQKMPELDDLIREGDELLEVELGML